MRSGIRLLLGVAMSALGVTPAAPADAPTVYTATYVEVVPPSTAQGAALLRQYREASRKDRGNLRIEVLQRIDRPNQFTILAVWKDPQALEAHAAGAAAVELRAKLAPLLASPSDERLHHGLVVGAAPAASAAGPIYAVTHVDVIPPRKEDGVALLGNWRRTVAKTRATCCSTSCNRPTGRTTSRSWRPGRTAMRSTRTGWPRTPGNSATGSRR